uniref:Uncharacterized protein n=1 Tax=Desulfitobacterium hafniense (strain Y51) TaxID=138119 RepID=Q8L173_DESHY|nr:hypothetical protein [Desulfitobacterium hafniense Y51]BAC00914.1 hypothetical protein [Desulfitobacterium hafniense Y51]
MTLGASKQTLFDLGLLFGVKETLPSSSVLVGCTCQWDDAEHILGLTASGIPRITLDTLPNLRFYIKHLALRGSDGFCEHFLTLSIE